MSKFVGPFLFFFFFSYSFSFVFLYSVSGFDETAVGQLKYLPGIKVNRIEYFRIRNFSFAGTLFYRTKFSFFFFFAFFLSYFRYYHGINFYFDRTKLAKYGIQLFDNKNRKLIRNENIKYILLVFIAFVKNIYQKKIIKINR